MPEIGLRLQLGVLGLHEALRCGGPVPISCAMNSRSMTGCSIV
jgi:hypothetical protein